jgi:maleate cis-trans isomerase
LTCNAVLLSSSTVAGSSGGSAATATAATAAASTAVATASAATAQCEAVAAVQAQQLLLLAPYKRYTGVEVFYSLLMIIGVARSHC